MTSSTCLERREEGDRSHVAAIPYHNEDGARRTSAGGRSAEKVKKAVRSAEGQRPKAERERAKEREDGPALESYGMADEEAERGES